MNKLFNKIKSIISFIRIKIFTRTKLAKVALTPKGERMLTYCNNIVKNIEQEEDYYIEKSLTELCSRNGWTREKAANFFILIANVTGGINNE